MTTIAFFNNKGGVGKTSLVYHLAWMYAELGVPVLAADLDPQANLSGMFLEEEALAGLWDDELRSRTVYGALRPLFEGTGPLGSAEVVRIEPRLGLLAGDLALSLAEDEFNAQWPRCMDGNARAFNVVASIGRLVEEAARSMGAKIVLLDVGPNLGAVNRTALLAAEHVVVPLAPDLYSLQGLRNLGPTLRRWREEWSERRRKNPHPNLPLPGGEMRPAGYVVMQHAARLDRPTKAYEKWTARIPATYRTAVLAESGADAPVEVGKDEHLLGALRHYRSLMPLAQDARKPMFHLRSADGALGSLALAVRSCFADFEKLAQRIAQRCGVALPTSG